MDVNSALATISGGKERERQTDMSRIESNWQNCYEPLTRNILRMGYHRLALDVFRKRDGCFLTTWLTSAVKQREFAQKPENAAIGIPARNMSSLPTKLGGCWNATQPLQIVVSDMTMFKVGNTYWEWTILLDTFNNEILAHSVTSQTGSNKPYYYCLEELKKRMNKREEQTSQVVLHTDQGAVYSSRAFCQAHRDYNILRSMSRGGTPTDNPIIEALNGWIKETLSGLRLSPYRRCSFSLRYLCPLLQSQSSRCRLGL